jgi:hypothetical protein
MDLQRPGWSPRRGVGGFSAASRHADVAPVPPPRRTRFHPVPHVAQVFNLCRNTLDRRVSSRRRSGQPMPCRRTFPSALQASALSDAAVAPPSWLRSAAYAGSRARAAPRSVPRRAGFHPVPPRSTGFQPVPSFQPVPDSKQAENLLDGETGSTVRLPPRPAGSASGGRPHPFSGKSPGFTGAGGRSRNPHNRRLEKVARRGCAAGRTRTGKPVTRPRESVACSFAKPVVLGSS